MAKKEYRWETGRAFVNYMLPTLPSSSYSAVVLYCWFHAKGEETEFQESCGQIGKACRLSVRQVRRILSDLERSGCMEKLEEGCGMKPSRRRLIRMKYISPPKEGGHG